MRYYSIIITDPVSGAIVRPKSLAALNLPATYTSFVNGQTLPGALNVELDLSVFDFATPAADSFVRVCGVSLEEVSQANDLNGKNIAVYAGMQKGLPLANPKQAGLIVKGFVFKAFGNWIGPSQTLDLIVQAGSSPDGLGSAAKPKNLLHSWKKGTPLGDAIKNTLSTAFPGYTANVNVSPKLVLAEDDTGYYADVTQYAQYVQNTSRAIIGGGYQGVHVTLTDKAFNVYDGTTQTAPKQIDFLDLIGQPTWIDPLTLQFQCTMRADLSVGDYVKMPPTAVTTTSGGAVPSGSTLRASSVFQGTFQVGQVRSVGNYRQPSGASWVTVVNAYSVQT